MVDRYTGWPEAVPIGDQEAATVARAFYDTWIARFGTTHLRTTAYHPSTNGMVERLHRQLKGAIMCHQNNRWTEALSSVMLGIRAAWKKDFQELRQRVRNLKLCDGTRHETKKTFIFKDLSTSEKVFVRHDGPKQPFQHDGPYRVVKQSAKTTDEPAPFADQPHDEVPASTTARTTRSGRRVRFPERLQSRFS
ncbi:uncharacterized protein LOC135145955 [Zophobas morio]|uniref:uncharacterized protein LOC135145955 n=1 Tax=Zophobas morio TaxID=2755281 RepID=UPI003083921A